MSLTEFCFWITAIMVGAIVLGIAGGTMILRLKKRLPNEGP